MNETKCGEEHNKYGASFDNEETIGKFSKKSSNALNVKYIEWEVKFIVLENS